MAIELRLPSPEDYPNDPVGYATAIFDAQAEYRRKCFAAIDSVPQLRSERPVSMTPPAPTIHDYLVQHPSLLKRYREIGPMALLEI